MKVIQYNLCSLVQRSRELPQADENAPVEYEYREEEILTPVTLRWSEANEKLAQREAYKGEYTITDDGREESPAVKIKRLKKQLSATDYKVIKCAECQLMGEEMPYDVAELHAERQAIRDEINLLENV